MDFIIAVLLKKNMIFEFFVKTMQNSCLSCQENQVMNFTSCQCKKMGIVDVNLTVSVMETHNIQEAHGTIIPIVCDLVEKELFSTPPFKGE